VLALTAFVVGRVFSIALLFAGCGGERVISVLPARTAIAAEASPPLRVAVDTTSTHLPLVVSGASIAYGDVDRALARAVEHALDPTLAELARRNARKLDLSVELLEARAEWTQDRVTVRLAVRATLRENAGNVYLAQTHAHASASAAVPAEHGAQVVLDCTDSIGRKLSGWLTGMDLR
jgi:L-asparaginase II